MEAEDPLSELADIHLPGDISWWPPAPGWWIVAALVLILGALVLRQWLGITRQKRRQTAALKELEKSYQTFRQNAPELGVDAAGSQYLADVNGVLRRVALQYYPTREIAGLSSAQWLSFLDRCDGGERFVSGPGQALGEALYRRTFDADAQALDTLAREWVCARYREHNRQPFFPGLREVRP